MKNQDLERRFDKMEEKMDKIRTETIPQLLIEVAKITTKAKVEAKEETKTYSRIWGVITLLVSLSGIAVAYFKH